MGIIRALLIVAGLAFMVNPGGASAQSNLLDQGQKLLGGLGGDTTGGALSTDEIASGLREALRVGSERVVGQVGRADG